MNSLTRICFLTVLMLVCNVHAADKVFQQKRGDLELKATATATWMVFVTVYDAGLYAPANSTSSDLLKTDMPLSLEIVYHVDVKKSQLIEAADIALSRQHGESERARFKNDVDELHEHYVDVTEDDRFRMDIGLGQGLSLFFNNHLVYQNSDMAFAKYYVGLWLAENPLSDKVRDALLNWND